MTWWRASRWYERVLRVMDAARMFQTLICLPLIPQMPSLGDSLKPIVEHWRTMPFAAGLE